MYDEIHNHQNTNYHHNTHYHRYHHNTHIIISIILIIIIIILIFLVMIFVITVIIITIITPIIIIIIFVNITLITPRRTLQAAALVAVLNKEHQSAVEAAQCVRKDLDAAVLEDVMAIRSASLLATPRVYSQRLAPYWPLLEYILSAWHPIGHS